jgi:purine-binding chemotaxis protein CheW
MMPLGFQSSSQQPGDTVPFLVFRVREHLCALPLDHVVETMRLLPVKAFIGVPDAIRGLTVIRGEPTPVVEMGLFLDGVAGSPTRFVTVRTGTHCVALAVESIMGLHYFPLDIVKETPPLLREADTHAVAAVGTLDTELMLVLNTAHLVPDSVWELISTPGDSA